MTCRCAPNARCGRCEESIERILVDDETFDRLTHAIENPRPPNEALIALFREESHETKPTVQVCARCTRRKSASNGCPDKCKPQRLAGES